MEKNTGINNMNVNKNYSLLNIFSPKLIIAEMPLKFKWRLMLKHLSSMMRTHDLLQKDVSSMDWLVHPDMDKQIKYYQDKNNEWRERYTKFLNGEEVFKKFYMYKYNEVNGFILLRPPI